MGVCCLTSICTSSSVNGTQLLLENQFSSSFRPVVQPDLTPGLGYNDGHGTQTQPIRAPHPSLHPPPHGNWFGDGHVAQTEPMRISPTTSVKLLRKTSSLLLRLLSDRQQQSYQGANGDVAEGEMQTWWCIWASRSSCAWRRRALSMNSVSL